MRHLKSAGPLLLAAVMVLAFGCSRQAEPPVEVPLSDLERVEGRLHLRGGSEPFSGVMAEHYADGTLKSRSEVSGGVLNGKSEGWYPDGVLQVREFFVEGVSHGVRTRWHSNGVKASEAELVEGRLHGGFRRWHENGVLAEETWMERGEPRGDSVAYFESGYVRAHARVDGKEILEQTFWQDGERSSSEFRLGADSSR